jgi:hypothetical protein
MRVLALRQTPASLEVFGEILGLLDGGDDSLVNLLLVCGPRFRERLLGFWLAFLEKLLLGRPGTLNGGFREVGVIDFLINLDPIPHVGGKSSIYAIKNVP